MSDCKRSAPTMAAMEASSNRASISKKRKTSIAASSEFQLCSYDHVQQQQLRNSQYSLGNLQDMTVSPATSVNSACTVVSGEFFSDRSPLSCCSSSNIETGEVVKKSNRMPLDLELQTKGFETVDSTFNNFKSFSMIDRQYLLSEFSGDSEDSTMCPAKSSAAVVSEHWKSPAVKMPPKAEIDEFFAKAEKYEQKWFAEKYNFDIVEDMPLEGRYQWVRLH